MSGADGRRGVATVSPGCSPAADAAIVREIACDESGSEGEKLVGGTTDVFAHASLRIDTEAAAACITELRGWTRSPAEEYKAGVVLRQQNRAALQWLLGPAGPIHGHAHVHLTEKAFFVVRAALDFLVGDSSWRVCTGTDRGLPDETLASYLHREGPRAVGSPAWQGWLSAFNDLLRSRTPEDVEVNATIIFAMLDGLREQPNRGDLDPLWELMAQAESELPQLVGRLLDSSRMAPRLDPLVPALVRAVEFWGVDGHPIAIVHDEQHALTTARISYVQQQVRDRVDSFGASQPGGASTSGPLVHIRLVDSRDDPRVQVADLLAGAARRIASEALQGRADSELLALIRPYVSAASIWGDQATAVALLPTVD